MKSCPSLQQLSAAVDGDLSPELRGHLSTCEACTGALSEFTELKSMAQALPYEAASAQDKAGRHRALMQAAATLQPRRGVGYLGPVLAAAAVGLFVVGAGQLLSSKPSAMQTHALRASVQAPEGTAFSHYVLQAPEGPQEVVELVDGELTLDTLALEGRPFVLKTPEGIIQAQQGRLLAAVSKGHLTRLEVLSGQAQWARADKPTLHLSAGAQWQAPQEELPAVEQSRLERLFEEGMTHVESGAFVRAAAVFFEARTGAEGQALAEDATYWWAVSEGRAGHKTRAIEALELFMKTYAASPRASEVAVMLGWLQLEQGDSAGAELLFEAGLKSEDAEVESSAKRGLAACTQ